VRGTCSIWADVHLAVLIWRDMGSSAQVLSCTGRSIDPTKGQLPPRLVLLHACAALDIYLLFACHVHASFRNGKRSFSRLGGHILSFSLGLFEKTEEEIYNTAGNLFPRSRSLLCGDMEDNWRGCLGKTRHRMRICRCLLSGCLQGHRSNS
jgi:hypothetical protein